MHNLAGMTATAQALRPELLALPEPDRAELADLLLASLEPSFSESEESAFDAELARRAEEICSGRVIGHSPEEFFAQLDARLAAVAATRR